MRTGAAAAAAVAAWAFTAVPAGASGAARTADPASLGGLALFDRAGARLTRGTDAADWAGFVVAGNSGGPGVGTPAVVSAAVVDPARPPSTWATTVLVDRTANDTSTSAPAGLPAVLLPLSGAVVDTGSSRLAAALPTTTSASDSPLVVELRLSDSTRIGVPYWSAYLDVDPAAGTWQLATGPAERVTPALGSVRVSRDSSGLTTVRTSIAADANGGRPVGWVELFDGNGDRGAARYDPTSGAVVGEDLTPRFRTDYFVVLTPVDPVHYRSAGSRGRSGGSSSGGAATVPAGGSGSDGRGATAGAGSPQPTRLRLVVTRPSRGSAYGSTTIAVTVLPVDALGTVTVGDGGAFRASAPAVDGRVTVTTNALGAGTHVVTATFRPAAAGFRPSSATSAPFRLLARAGARPSDRKATPGQLTLTTPYGPDHPLKLGNFVLTPDGSNLVARAHVGTADASGRDGITVTDTRAGDPGWSASLLSSDLTNGVDTISAENFGFVDVRPVPLPGGGGLGTPIRPVITRDIPPSNSVQPAASSGRAGLARVAKVFASAIRGTGSVYIYGDLELQAPTSALTGEYSATLTFTVS